MAITLNLVPEEQAVSSGFRKAAGIARTLTVVFTAVLLIFIIGIIFYLVLNNNKLKELVSETDSLKSKISSLEVSEQQIILLKDRIGKIQSLAQLPSAGRNLSSVSTILSQLPSEVGVTELSLDSKKIDLSLKFKSNYNLSQFMDFAKNSEVFKSVVMSSFGMSPSSGYLVSLDLSGN